MVSHGGFTTCQYNHTSDSALKALCSACHATYISTSPLSNGRTMLRHKSLPSFKFAMFSADSSPSKAARRAESINSLRRSVSGMKTLLPLKLSSSLPTSTSSTSLSRSTFGFDREEEHSISRTSQLSSKRRFNIPRPITIRKEKYRDTPVYTEPGSPLLNLFYYQDEQVCSNSPMTESNYEDFSFGGYASSCSGDEDLEGLDEETPLPEGLSPARTNRRSRNSELSFQCLGEAGQPLFRDESAWLSSSLSRDTQRESIPQLQADNMPPEHNIEAWLSMSDTSSISEDEDDDSYACATVSLTSARAQVVDVNANRLSLKIPSRSSSLAGTRHQSLTSDGGCIPDSYTEWWNENTVSDDWLSHPPLPKHPPDPAITPPPSPKPKPSWRSRKPVGLGIVSKPNPQLNDNLPISSMSTSQILSELEESTTYSSSDTLQPYTPCIAAIRIHLEQSSHARTELQPPLRSPFSEGVDWRPQPPKPSHPKLSLKRTFSSRTSRTTPATKHSWSQLTPTPPSPNLHPLASIFPNTPHVLRSSLYAHILAHLFLSTLPSHHALPQPKTQTHTPPPSPPCHSSFFSTSCTTSHIPPKAAERLGITLPVARGLRINVHSDAITLRQSEMGIVMLEQRVRSRIAALVAEMGDEVDAGVSEALLRALCEIIRGCERDCFGFSRV